MNFKQNLGRGTAACDNNEARVGFWKKNRRYVYIASPLIVVLALTLWWFSDNHRFSQGMSYYGEDNDKAVSYFEMLSNHNSAHYSEAKHKAACYYLEKGDSSKAAILYTEAVKSQSWDFRPAYIDYVSLSASGRLEPYIKKDLYAAASLCLKSESPSNQLEGAALLYEGKYYDEACKIFDEYPVEDISMGYLGLYHLYGLGGKQQDIYAAKNLLNKAPDLNPFVAVKGDLAIYHGGMTDIHALSDALKYYQMAVMGESKPEYQLRYYFAQQMYNAMERANSSSEWGLSYVNSPNKRYWGAYSFANGTYRGEVVSRGGSEGAHGWGVFRFRDGGVNMGQFDWLSNNGLGFQMTPSGGGIHLLIGEFKDGTLENGFEITADGTVYQIGKIVY